LVAATMQVAPSAFTALYCPREIASVDRSTSVRKIAQSSGTGRKDSGLTHSDRRSILGAKL
jgi:hypothetical protein